MKWNKYDQHRKFQVTSLVPMSGHLLVERLQCKNTPAIRILINDRIQEIHNNNPISNRKEFKGIYSISDFENTVKRKWSSQGTFCEKCVPGNNSCINKISIYEPWQHIRYKNHINKSPPSHSSFSYSHSSPQIVHFLLSTLVSLFYICWANYWEDCSMKMGSLGWLMSWSLMARYISIGRKPI